MTSARDGSDGKNDRASDEWPGPGRPAPAAGLSRLTDGRQVSTGAPHALVITPDAIGRERRQRRRWQAVSPGTVAPVVGRTRAAPSRDLLWLLFTPYY